MTPEGVLALVGWIFWLMGVLASSLLASPFFMLVTIPCYVGFTIIIWSGIGVDAYAD